MTFDEVDDQLTLPRYNSLQRFWMKHPPTQILLAGYVGYKGTGAAAPAAAGDTTEDLAELDEESASALFGIFGVPVKPQKG